MVVIEVLGNYDNFDSGIKQVIVSGECETNRLLFNRTIRKFDIEI